MNGEDIISWYEGYTKDQGVEVLLDKRRLLACLMVRMSDTIMQLEQRHKIAYNKNKIDLAIKAIEINGTMQERNAHARKVTMESRMKEAEIEGKLKGYKLKFEAYCKVLDSMSSYINTMNRI